MLTNKFILFRQKNFTFYLWNQNMNHVKNSKLVYILRIEYVKFFCLVFNFDNIKND